MLAACRRCVSFDEQKLTNAAVTQSTQDPHTNAAIQPRSACGLASVRCTLCDDHEADARSRASPPVDTRIIPSARYKHTSPLAIYQLHLVHGEPPYYPPLRTARCDAKQKRAPLTHENTSRRRTQRGTSTRAPRSAALPTRACFAAESSRNRHRGPNPTRGAHLWSAAVNRNADEMSRYVQMSCTPMR